MTETRHATDSGLSEVQVRQFINDGFVRVDRAFSPELAAECRSILWGDIGFDREEASSGKHPVVRLGDYPQEPFRKAANAPALHAAFDQLVGGGRWHPRQSLGSFVVRFPSDHDPDDTGWHVDASFAPEAGDASFSSWRINVASRGRALLMLFLFSDVSRNDAPTRIRVGSHLDVARILQPAGAPGMSFLELAGALGLTDQRPEISAVGSAGTVYLCHPFLVHAGQRHCGKEPRFLAQPPLCPNPKEPLQLIRDDAEYSPVERAIRMGLGME